MRRQSVNKSKSAGTFRRHIKTTKSVNVAPPPMRGGYRL